MAKKTNTLVHGAKKYRLRVKCDDGFKNFYGNSQKEAEEQRDLYLEKISKQSVYALRSFGELFHMWFHEVLKPSVTMSTIQKYEIIYRLRIKPAHFYNMNICDVKSIDIQKHYNKIEPLKALEMHKLISHFSTFCIQEEIISKSFIRTVKLPKTEGTTDEEIAFLSPTCISKLTDALQDDPTLFIFIFALFTGLRQGEILALRHSDIYDNIIHVRQGIRRVKDIDSNETELKIGMLKTKSSMRDVPIMMNLKPLLMAHIAAEKKKTIGLGLSFNKHQLLFTTSILTPLNPSNLRRKWIATLKTIDEPYVKFHALRHTFCSMLAENGVHLKAASILMGHSDIQTTAKIYTHISDRTKFDAIEKLNSKLM